MLDITKVTLAQQIAHAIAEAISKGEVQGGERLHGSNLSERFGTSRAPIREAMYILEKEGLVERHPRRGVFVKEYTRDELLDLYEAGYRLEEIALAQVMDRASATEFAVLKEIVDGMGLAVKQLDVGTFLENIEKFYVRLFNIAGNRLLLDFHEQISRKMRPFRYMSLSYPKNLVRSLAEYNGMLEGLVAKNLDKVLGELRCKEKRATRQLLEHVAKRSRRNGTDRSMWANPLAASGTGGGRGPRTPVAS